jgi:16S rRNA (guanine527-N7)-methyltransferase
VSRAFADLADFVRLAGRHAAPQAALYAMKGLFPHEEIEQLPSGWSVRDTVRLDVPGLKGERHLVIVERSALPEHASTTS